ncbi:hypothetical protein [Pseudomonas sp. rhizo25]|uniref:hypothetical protein n=1 Tax=Pseudomonas sp. rhizo25 TaxID=3059675 RepID=UPI0028917CEF|nr:hypothetical protein [Pseudomonas sp. rhizo25]MDT3230881.1 hypothetical protein [Pseudomonas sp. rhizo25]
MHIKQQIDDAIFLFENKRYQGCLSLVMLAIGASSKKVFPYPPHRDNYAFEQFLGSRIASVLWGHRLGDGVGNSRVMFTFRGEDHLIEHILYKYYRCALVHEGELPNDVIFSPSVGMPESPGSQGVLVASGSNMVLDYNWLEVLIRCVTHAECNGDEFGIEHFRDVPVDGKTAEQVIDEVARRHDTSPGRVEIMRDAAYHLRRLEIKNLSVDELQAAFKECVRSGLLNAGCVTGLGRKSTYRYPEDQRTFLERFEVSKTAFCLTDGSLTEIGDALLRDVASNFVIQKVGS